jgi:hypothetical protein
MAFPLSQEKTSYANYQANFPLSLLRRLPHSPCLYYHLKLCPDLFPADDNYKKQLGKFVNCSRGKNQKTYP